MLKTLLPPQLHESLQSSPYLTSYLLLLSLFALLPLLTFITVLGALLAVWTVLAGLVFVGALLTAAVIAGVVWGYGVCVVLAGLWVMGWVEGRGDMARRGSVKGGQVDGSVDEGVVVKQEENGAGKREKSFSRKEQGSEKEKMMKDIERSLK